MLFKIKVTKIDYCVEDEDVCDLIDDDSEEAINKKIEEIKSELPQTMKFEIDCDKEDLDDLVCDYITEKNGWLIEGFDYEIIR